MERHPPSRSEMRQAGLSTFNVAHGLDLVLRAVSADQGGSELDEITEAWTVEDESSGGFGAAVPRAMDGLLACGRDALRIEADVAGVLERQTVRSDRSVHRHNRSTRGYDVRYLVSPRQDPDRADANAGPPTCSAAVASYPVKDKNSVGGEVVGAATLGAFVDVSYALRVHSRPDYVVPTPLRAVDSGDDFDRVWLLDQPAGEADTRRLTAILQLAVLR